MLRLAWRNLWRHSRRTWLTVGAMVFSSVLLIFMISLQVGTYATMIDNSLSAFTGHAQIQHLGFLDQQKIRQTVEEVEFLAQEVRNKVPGVSVAARGQAFALASSEERSYGILIMGIQPDHEADVSSLPGLLKHGRYLEDHHAPEIVVGKTLADNLMIGLGDELTLIGSALDGSFAANVVTVVGLFDSGIGALDRSIAQLPLGTFQDTFAMGDAGHAVVLLGTDALDSELLVAKVEPLVADQGNLTVLDWDELQPGLKQAIRSDIGSAFFMYAILTVLVAFSVLNTQLMSVMERTREFGTVMALGLKPGRLGRVVILEAALMGLIGVALSILIGGALTYWIGETGFTIPGMREMAERFNLPPRMYPDLTWYTLLIGPVVIFLFSMIASIYPALRLYRLHPVTAMRAAQ